MFQTKWWAYQHAESCMTGEFLRKMKKGLGLVGSRGKGEQAVGPRS